MDGGGVIPQRKEAIKYNPNNPKKKKTIKNFRQTQSNPKLALDPSIIRKYKVDTFLTHFKVKEIRVKSIHFRKRFKCLQRKGKSIY